MSKSAPPKQSTRAARESAGKRAENGKAGRLAVALRDNLKRRKAQQRARDDAGEPIDEPGNGGAA